jgi:hypothetical protein
MLQQSRAHHGNGAWSRPFFSTTANRFGPNCACLGADRWDLGCSKHVAERPFRSDTVERRRGHVLVDRDLQACVRLFWPIVGRLCFTFTIVHVVLRLMPSAFACLSSEVYPDAIRASAMCSIPTDEAIRPSSSSFRQNADRASEYQPYPNCKNKAGDHQDKRGAK